MESLQLYAVLTFLALIFARDVHRLLESFFQRFQTQIKSHTLFVLRPLSWYYFLLAVIASFILTAKVILQFVFSFGSLFAGSVPWPVLVLRVGILLFLLGFTSLKLPTFVRDLIVLFWPPTSHFARLCAIFHGSVAPMGSWLSLSRTQFTSSETILLSSSGPRRNDASLGAGAGAGAEGKKRQPIAPTSNPAGTNGSSAAGAKKGLRSESFPTVANVAVSSSSSSVSAASPRATKANNAGTPSLSPIPGSAMYRLAEAGLDHKEMSDHHLLRCFGIVPFVGAVMCTALGTHSYVFSISLVSSVVSFALVRTQGGDNLMSGLLNVCLWVVTLFYMVMWVFFWSQVLINSSAFMHSLLLSIALALAVRLVLVHETIWDSVVATRRPRKNQRSSTEAVNNLASDVKSQSTGAVADNVVDTVGQAATRRMMGLRHAAQSSMWRWSAARTESVMSDDLVLQRKRSQLLWLSDSQAEAPWCCYSDTDVELILSAGTWVPPRRPTATSRVRPSGSSSLHADGLPRSNLPSSPIHSTALPSIKTPGDMSFGSVAPSAQVVAQSPASSPSPHGGSEGSSPAASTPSTVIFHHRTSSGSSTPSRFGFSSPFPLSPSSRLSRNASSFHKSPRLAPDPNAVSLTSPGHVRGSSSFFISSDHDLPADSRSVSGSPSLVGVPLDDSGVKKSRPAQFAGIRAGPVRHHRSRTTLLMTDHPPLEAAFLDEMETVAHEARKKYQGRMRRYVYAASILVSFFWPSIVMSWRAVLLNPARSLELGTVFLSYFFVNGFMTAVLLDYWALYLVYRMRTPSMQVGAAVVVVLAILMGIAGFNVVSIAVSVITVYGLWPIQQSIGTSAFGANVNGLSGTAAPSVDAIRASRRSGTKRFLRLFLTRFNWRISLLMMAISCIFVATTVSLWMAVPTMPSSICDHDDPNATQHAQQAYQYIYQGQERPPEFVHRPVIYPVCSMTWRDLDIVDASLFAETVYWPLDKGQNFIQTWYPDNRMTLRNYSTDSRSGLGFRVYLDNRTNLTIIAVRGTQTLVDLFQDIDLFAEIAMLQFFSVFMPSVFILPRTFVSSLVLFSSYIDPLLLVQDRHYHHELVHLVSDLIRDVDREKVVMTGHSLGGAICQIIGTQLNIPALTFSAPGNLYSALKFDMSPQLANHLAVNVAPDGDPVPLIDFQAGLVQKINCPSFLMCHLMLNTLRELILSCRDSLQAKHFAKLFCEIRPFG